MSFSMRSLNNWKNYYYVDLLHHQRQRHAPQHHLNFLRCPLDLRTPANAPSPIIDTLKEVDYKQTYKILRPIRQQLIDHKHRA